jgi:hypothetical protein
MATTRKPLLRSAARLDDYRLCELLTLRAPLIPTKGFYDPNAPADLCSHKRDTTAIATAWRAHEMMLLHLWISGWLPTLKFIAYEPGAPGTRPPGWWRYLTSIGRERHETEERYLTSHCLWLDGEQEAAAAHALSAQFGLWPTPPTA